MPGWENIAMQGAGQVVGGAMGLLLGGIERKKQLEQQKKLQALQIAGQQEMGDYNMRKQLELWEATGYRAQKEQMKAAGLNPALMYGMGGGGGQTASANPANVAGAQARQGGEAAAMGMQMGQAAMMAAQIELLKAQTKKTEAEAAGVPTTVEKTGQEIINLKTQNAIDEIRKAFDADTLKNRESLLNIALSKLIEETKIIENDRKISDATRQSSINRINQEALNKVKEGLLLDKQAAKTEKESYYIEKQIRAIQQQITINSQDEKAAAAGVNPKAGTMLKTGYNIYTIIKNILGL